MFNSKGKKDAILRMKNEKEKLDKVRNEAIKESQRLYEIRLVLKDQIKEAWDAVNRFRNTPETFQADVKTVEISYEKYSAKLTKIQQTANKVEFNQTTSTAATTAAGIGVAALGPTALMGIATTFGTASTGAAISTLGGAAATNAALAWLGGGALAAGGGGIAAGDVLLGLAGPIGWGIAGIGAVTAGFLASGKNKKVMAEANQQTEKIYASKLALEGTMTEIEHISKQTVKVKDDIHRSVTEISEYNVNYNMLDENQQYRLGAFVNNLKSAIQLLNQVVGK